MNSLTFRERFKDKLGIIFKNGSFDIKESSAVVKKQLPEGKFHPVHKSQTLKLKGIEKNSEYCNSIKYTEAYSHDNQSYFIYPYPQQSEKTRKEIETTFNSISLKRKFSDSLIRNNKLEEKSINKLPILRPKFRIAGISKTSLESCFRYSSSMQKHK